MQRGPHSCNVENALYGVVVVDGKGAIGFQSSNLLWNDNLKSLICLYLVVIFSWWCYLWKYRLKCCFKPFHVLERLSISWNTTSRRATTWNRRGLQWTPTTCFGYDILMIWNRWMQQQRAGLWKKGRQKCYGLQAFYFCWKWWSER